MGGVRLSTFRACGLDLFMVRTTLVIVGWFVGHTWKKITISSRPNHQNHCVICLLHTQAEIWPQAAGW
jgi:hypothetical protein